MKCFDKSWEKTYAAHPTHTFESAPTATGGALNDQGELQCGVLHVTHH